MDYREFLGIVRPLIVQYGNKEYSDERLKLLFTKCHRAGPVWLKDVVSSVVLAHNRWFDWDAAIKARIAHLNDLNKTEIVGELAKTIQNNTSNDGLDKALKLFGARSLIEAIQNSAKYDLLDKTIPELEVLGPALYEHLEAQRKEDASFN